MATLCPLLKFREVDANGNPLVGGKIYAYEAGSFTIAKDTYSDQEGTIPNTNPVILDSAGRAAIYLSGFYNFRVTDSLDNTIYDSVNVTGGAINDFVATTYDEWSDALAYTSLPSATSYTVTGIDSTATEVVIDLFNLDTSGSNGIALRLGNGSIITTGYTGNTITQTVTAGLVTGQDWLYAALGSLSAGTYASIVPNTFTYDSSRWTITLRKVDAASPQWTISIQGWAAVGVAAIQIFSGFGRLVVSGSLDRFQLITSGSDTLSGNIVVRQYANTGQLIGANSGPFANHYTSTGTNAYTLTKMDGGNAGSAYFDGQEFFWTPANTNTLTSVTANPSSYGAKTVIMPDGSAVPIGFIRANVWNLCHYDEAADKLILDYPRVNGTIDIADSAITTAKIADSAITTAKLAANSVTSAKIVDGTIVAADIADGTITSAKLATGIGIVVKSTTVSVTYTAAGTIYTLPHTLAQIPDWYDVYLECIGADGAWSVGDTWTLATYRSDYSIYFAEGQTLYADATNIYVLVGSTGMAGLNKSTFGNFNVSVSSKWKFYAKAFKT